MLDRLLNLVTGSPAFQFLRSVPPFDTLADAELSAVSDRLSIEYRAAGTTLFVQGQSRLTDLYLLLKGSLQLTDEAAGAQATARTLGVGRAFGGRCLLENDGLALWSARTLEDTFFYVLPGALFLELCERHREVRDYFADGLGPRMLERVGLSMRRRWLVPPGGADASVLHRTAGELCARPAPTCAPSEPLRGAARRLGGGRALLVVADGRAAGLLTAQDVVEKAVAAGMDPQHPVSGIMGPPPPSVGEHTPVTEALESMVRSGARAVAVTGADGRLAGLLGDEEILVSHGASPLDFLRDLATIRLRKDLADHRAHLPGLVRRLMLEGARIDSLTWLVSTASDLTVRRLIELAIEELGPPPAPFAFLALGSEGRREQTLSSDQDNALVWADGPGQTAAPYFRALAERVCAWLSQAGLDYCPGNVMASNPRWCQSLSVWKEYFADWVKRPRPEALLHAGIFFDFRAVWGEESLAMALRAHVEELLAPRPGLFFRLLADEVASLRPVAPARGAERFVGDAVDLKPAVANLSDLTRLYALWHRVSQTGTLPRLRQLEAGSDLGPKTCQELGQAYAFLMQTRLARQVAGLVADGAPPEQLLQLRELTPLERRFLEQTLELMRRVRHQVERHFLRQA